MCCLALLIHPIELVGRFELELCMLSALPLFGTLFHNKLV
jgi:hypothetical protein